MTLYRILLTLHLLGATVWVGGHAVLAFSILPQALAARDPAPLLGFEARFERIGMPALLAQVASGLWLAQHWLPIGAWLDWGGSPIARLISAKLALLAATLALALNARLRVIPRLDAQRLPLLALHIHLVLALGIGFVVVGMLLRTGG